jgi:hypothetical protein
MLLEVLLSIFGPKPNIVAESDCKSSSFQLRNFCDSLHSEHDSLIHSHQPAERCILYAVQKGIMNAMHYVITYSISAVYAWKFT